MPLELIPLCTIDAVLAEPLVPGAGPAGFRMVFEVKSATVSGERITGSLRHGTAADWIVLNGTVGTLDVRTVLETTDGAIIYCTYEGRVDLSQGPGALPMYVAPKFETGDDRYAWLNTIQAIGVGTTEGSALHYEWFEARVRS